MNQNIDTEWEDRRREAMEDGCYYDDGCYDYPYDEDTQDWYREAPREENP